LKQLKRAVTLAPTSAAVLAVVLDGLREAGRSRLAERWLTAARFRTSADAAMKHVWQRAQFEMARESQASRVGRGTLPFLRVATPTTSPTIAGGIVRRDVVSRAVPHLGRLRAYRAEQG
ncbi:MAG: hypothetical protein ACRC7O_00355, partial [Fimbriiglobus sp.]